MAVNFKNHHLHVGYRMRDWHYVWYKPILNPNYDAVDPMIGLYMDTKGDEDLERSPTEGEVLWFPPFDVRFFESKSNPERKRLQKIFLYDAWRYLDEKNEAELVALQDQLEQEDYRKWEAWFDHAKEWKSTQTRRRRAARRARERRKARGENVPSIEDDDFSILSDDSAYDSLAQSEKGVSKGSGETAPDGLPIHQSIGSKRPFTADNNDIRNSKTAKKARAGPSQTGRGRQSAGASGADVSMSGGLGYRTPEVEGNDIFRKPQYPRSEAPPTKGSTTASRGENGNVNGITSCNTDRTTNGNAKEKTSDAPENESIYDDDDVAIEANGGYDDEDEALNEAIRRSSVPPEGRESSG